MSPKKTLNIISLKKHMNKKSLKVLSKFSQSLLSQGSLPNSLPYPSHTRAQLSFLSQRSVCLRAYSYILQIWTHPKVQESCKQLWVLKRDPSDLYQTRQFLVSALPQYRSFSGEGRPKFKSKKAYMRQRQWFLCILWHSSHMITSWNYSYTV